jgi:proteasome lid subunit RPN8/RPN11
MGKSDVVGIAHDTLLTALASAADYHPRKFVAHLRSEEAHDVGVEREGEVLTEVIFTPESKRSDTFDTLGVDTLPRRASIVGTVASAPTGEPESEDYTRFANRGRVHIVTVPPYEDDPGSWCAYDSDGTERGLDVVEVEFEDDDGWLNLDFSFTR